MRPAESALSMRRNATEVPANASEFPHCARIALCVWHDAAAPVWRATPLLARKLFDRARQRKSGGFEVVVRCMVIPYSCNLY